MTIVGKVGPDPVRKILELLDRIIVFCFLAVASAVSYAVRIPSNWDSSAQRQGLGRRLAALAACDGADTAGAAALAAASWDSRNETRAVSARFSLERALT